MLPPFQAITRSGGQNLRPVTSAVTRIVHSISAAADAEHLWRESGEGVEPVTTRDPNAVFLSEVQTIDRQRADDSDAPLTAVHAALPVIQGDDTRGAESPIT
jgi:hypothetical protein